MIFVAEMGKTEGQAAYAKIGFLNGGCNRVHGLEVIQRKAPWPRRVNFLV